jgi:hypothetical protein
MAEELDKLYFSIQADLSTLKTNLSSAQNEVNRFSGEMKSRFSELGTAIKGILGAYIGIQSFHQIIGFFKDASAAATENKLAVEGLRNALGYLPQALIAQANAIQKVSLYSHDAVTGMQAMLASYVKSEDEIKKLTPAIVDFAARMGMDLDSAARLVGKSIDGTTNALGRYGINIKDCKTETERVDAIISSIDKKFGGYAKTVSDAGIGTKNLANAWSDFLEVVGGEVNPILKAMNDLLRKGLESTTAFLEKGLVAVEDNAKTLDIKKRILQNEINLLGVKQQSSNLTTEEIARLKILQSGLDKVIEQLRTGNYKGIPLTPPSNLEPGKSTDPKAQLAILDAALNKYEANIKFILANLDRAFDENRITIEKWGEDQKKYLIQQAEVEIKNLEEKIKLCKEDDQKTELRSKLDVIQIDLKNKLADVEAKVNTELKKQNDLKADAIDKLETESAKAKETVLGGTSGDSAELRQLKKSQTEEQKVLKDAYKLQYDNLIKAGNNKIQAKNALADQEILIQHKVTQDEQELAKKSAEIQRQKALDTLNALQSITSGFTQMMTNLASLTGEKSKMMFDITKAAAMAEAIVNIALGYTKALSQGGVYGAVLGAIVLTAGAVQMATIASTEYAPPKAEKGGLLYGKRHSQGGIPIEAEGGEYIQPRPAVTYYGLNVMEAIRQRAIPKSAFAGIGSFNTKNISGIAAVGGSIPSSIAKNQTTIVNFVDPILMENYLSTARGQRAIVNVIKQNYFELSR